MMIIVLLMVWFMVSNMVFMIFGSVVGRIILWMVFDLVVFIVKELLCSDCGMELIILFDNEEINGISIIFIIELVVRVFCVGVVMFSVLVVF